MTTSDLLEVWREAMRAAELAARLAQVAADKAEQADLNAAGAEEVATLAEQLAAAATAAAAGARAAANHARGLALDAGGGDERAADDDRSARSLPKVRGATGTRQSKPMPASATRTTSDAALEQPVAQLQGEVTHDPSDRACARLPRIRA